MDDRPTFMSVAQRLMSLQFGIVSREQLIRRGVPGSTVDARLSRGQIKPVFAGKYMLRGNQLSRKGLWAAALLKGGKDSALCASTAAVFWGFMEANHIVEVVGERRTRSAIASEKVEGEVVSARFRPRFMDYSPEEDVVRQNRFPVVTVETAISQLAADLPEREFVDVFSEADRLNLINDRALALKISARKGMPGGPLLEAVAGDRDPNISRTRSMLEVKLARLIKGLEIEPPEVNVMIEGHLVDFVWRKQRLIVETDGYRYHRGREKFEKDAATRNHLRSLGWTVLVYTYRMIENDPVRVGAEIRAALESGPRFAEPAGGERLIRPHPPPGMSGSHSHA